MAYTLEFPVFLCDMFRHQLQGLLALSHHSELVPGKVQHAQVEQLKTTLRDEKFFFVINFLTFQTEHICGTEHWLGCDPGAFTIEKYCSLIHPSHFAALMTYSGQLLGSLLSGEHPVAFMRPCLTESIALQHASGKYLLFKKFTRPFQYDQDFRLLSCLNEFMLVGPYQGEFYNARISDCNEDTLRWHEEIQRRTRTEFQKMAPFSAQELRILGEYAHDPLITTAQVAKAFQIKESTVITYKKRILSKAEIFFHQRFHSARDTAQCLKAGGLL